MKKVKYTYGEIVSVGRSLRRYENLLNNYMQFKDAFKFIIGDIEVDSFEKIEESILKQVARYRCVYQNMLNTIK